MYFSSNHNNTTIYMIDDTLLQMFKVRIPSFPDSQYVLLGHT